MNINFDGTMIGQENDRFICNYEKENENLTINTKKRKNEKTNKKMNCLWDLL